MFFSIQSIDFSWVFIHLCSYPILPRITRKNHLFNSPHSHTNDDDAYDMKYLQNKKSCCILCKLKSAKDSEVECSCFRWKIGCTQINLWSRTMTNLFACHKIRNRKFQLQQLVIFMLLFMTKKTCTGKTHMFK